MSLCSFAGLDSAEPLITAVLEPLEMEPSQFLTSLIGSL